MFSEHLPWVREWYTPRVLRASQLIWESCWFNGVTHVTLSELPSLAGFYFPLLSPRETSLKLGSFSSWSFFQSRGWLCYWVYCGKERLLSLLEGNYLWSESLSEILMLPSCHLCPPLQALNTFSTNICYVTDRLIFTMLWINLFPH